MSRPCRRAFAFVRIEGDAFWKAAAETEVCPRTRNFKREKEWANADGGPVSCHLSA
jgi:hypothetical protein